MYEQKHFVNNDIGYGFKVNTNLRELTLEERRKYNIEDRITTYLVNDIEEFDIMVVLDNFYKENNIDEFYKFCKNNMIVNGFEIINEEKYISNLGMKKAAWKLLCKDPAGHLQVSYFLQFAGINKDGYYPLGCISGNPTKDHDVVEGCIIEMIDNWEYLDGTVDAPTIQNETPVINTEEVKSIINIPGEYKKLETLANSPQGAISFGKRNESSMVVIHEIYIDKTRTMPFDNKQEIIDSIRKILKQNQGLIEVNTGLTNNQKKYAYLITKTLSERHSMQYSVTMHIESEEKNICIFGYFDEVGITGQRESVMTMILANEGKIKLDAANFNEMWTKDPYDESYKTGLVMNLSEYEQYDAQFPTHPLTEARKFVKYVIENN